jgi:hAT family C-terminal dimerisation region
MAIDILSIPAMSAEAERVFSGARRTISWTRCRLGATVVEQTECLKSWIREVVKSGGFASEEVAAEVLNIEGELDNRQDNNIGNNQVVDEEYEEA